eukprot:gene657-711_t
MNFNRQVDHVDKKKEPYYPARVLTIHCLLKGAQLGAVLGTAVTPVYAYYYKVPRCQAWTKCAPVGLLAGTGFGLALLTGKWVSGVLDEKGVDDRANRLLLNKGQLQVDRMSLTGAAFGTIAGTFIWTRHGQVGDPRIIIAGLTTGMAFGVGAYLWRKQMGQVCPMEERRRERRKKEAEAKNAKNEAINIQH